MKKRVIDIFLLVYVCFIVVQSALEAESFGNRHEDFQSRGGKSDRIRVYELNKKVCDFPEVADLSTPEAAYATIMRDYMTTGASLADWSKISTRKMTGTERKKVPPERAQSYLNARIVEVRIFKERTARVFAEMEEDGND